MNLNLLQTVTMDYKYRRSDQALNCETCSKNGSDIMTPLLKNKFTLLVLS